MANFIESKNPVLSEEKLKKSSVQSTHSGPITMADDEAMTISGAINKTIFLFALMMVTTAISFFMPTQFLLWVGLLGGLAAVIACTFKPKWSPVLAPGYALFEGFFLGTISYFYASAFYEGIIFQAVGLTMGTLFMMLMIYKSGLIPVTKKLKTGIVMATGAIFLMYMISIIGSFFGFQVPYLHDSGPIGIGISVVILIVAALNLLLDFDLFVKGEKHQAPKYMEWFAGMALLVTLVWLYIEFLRLLSKLNSD